MLLDIFNKKRLRSLKNKEIELYAELKKINLENKMLRETLDFTSSQLNRIKFLQKEYNDSKIEYRIEETKKGVSVFTVLNHPKSEIEIFDLNVKEPNCNKELVLWTRHQDEKTLFIIDIRGGKSLGHGELAMNHVINYAKENGYEKITGNLSPYDIENHGDRLRAFYNKFGFTVDFGNGAGFGSIQRFLTHTNSSASL